MIEFILGRSGSGKSTYLFSLTEQALQQGRRVCLLVPEQESMNTERLCQVKYGEEVEVLSFRRLCDALMRVYGGGARARLGEVARLGILYRAVQAVSPRLRYYRKNAKQVRFYEKLMSVMEDFAAYRADEAQILPLIENENVKNKYHDLFLIYESYNALRRQEYRDHFDDLETTCKLLSDHAYFENKLVLIDHFGGFTAQEYALIEKIFLQAHDCALTLTADTKDASLFAPTLSHLARLERLCLQLGLRTKRTELSGNYRHQSQNLAVLEQYLFSSVTPADPAPADGSVRIFSAASPDAEVRLVAQDIRRRVLTGECRYCDISVVSNVQSEYQHTVEMIFDELEIPLYTDRTVDVLSRPLFSLILHAMDAVEYNYRYEDMFSLAATYLCGLNHEEVARLENYVYMWNIRGKKWETEWTQNPFGLTPREDPEESRLLLERINDIRQRLITPLIEFAEDTRAGKATDLLAALWRLIENYNIPAQLFAFAEAEKDQNEKTQWLRLYELLIELMDQLVLALGETIVSRKTLHDIMEVCLRGSRFGVLPAYMDQVHFGDMIRSRSTQVRHLYVLGASAGKFPAAISGSNMITDNDIRQFRRQNILLSKDSLTLGREQQLCLYRTVAAASESVTFTFSNFSSDGKIQLASGLLERITDKLISVRLHEDPAVMTHQKDLLRTAMFLPEDSEWIPKLDEFFARAGLPAVASLRHKKREDKKLPRAVVEALYGKTISASQSRLESFVGCPFHYFLDYGLGLEENEPVTFAANCVGDFVHYGLEMLFNEIAESDDLAVWDYARVDAALERYAEKYYNDQLSDLAAARFDHLFDRIKRTMLLAGRSALDELKAGDFRPASMEYKFKRCIDIGGGMNALVNGRIDRVDAATIDGQQWIRVFDYKTGDKKMNLEMICNGYQLQLPLYTGMLREENEFKGAQIAAMEYFLAEVPSFDEKSVDAVNDPQKLAGAFHRRGLFTSDVAIIEALDRQRCFTGVLTKDRRISSRALVADHQQMQALCDFVLDKTVEIARRIADGEVEVCPMKQGTNACQYCKFDGICRFEYGKSKVRKYQRIESGEFLKSITEKEASE